MPPETPAVSSLPRWNLDPLRPTTDDLAVAVEMSRQSERVWRDRLDTTASALAEALHLIGRAHLILTRAAAYLTLRDADGTLNQTDLEFEENLQDAIDCAEQAVANVTADLLALDVEVFDALVQAAPLAEHTQWLHQLHADALGHEPGPFPTDLPEAMVDVADRIDRYHQLLASVWITTPSYVGGVDGAVTAASGRADLRHVEVLAAVDRELSARVDEAALCLDALVRSRLRHRSPGDLWADRAHGNGSSPAGVDALVAAVASEDRLAAQWWTRRLLQPPRDHVDISFARAGRYVHEALDEIDAALGAVIRAMLAERTIDAAPDPEKHINAFCLLPSPADMPFVCLSYASEPRDVITLAHEVGHALHYSLAAQARPPLVAEAPTLPSEVAAFLVESIVIDHILDVGTPQERDAFGDAAAQNAINATFRQAAITHWERRIYEASAAGQSLDAALLCATWKDTAGYLAPLIEKAPTFGLDWMRVSHVAQEAFYNATYVQAYLLAMAARTRGRPEPGVLIEFLASGNARSITDQLGLLGLGDHHGWRQGAEALIQQLSVSPEPQPPRNR